MFNPGNIGIGQLLILFAIIVLLFGTKRLRNLGSDLGSALKGFRKGFTEDEDPARIDADPEPEHRADKDADFSEERQK